MKMDSTAAIRAELSAIRARLDVQRLAIREALKHLTATQANACARGVREGVAQLLERDGPFTGAEDEALAVELALTLQALGGPDTGHAPLIG